MRRNIPHPSAEERRGADTRGMRQRRGAGEPPAIPTGQYATDTALELRMWQRGFRKTGANAMQVVVKDLNDEEIAAVPAHFQQLRGTGGA
jgi:cytochrome c553